MWCFLLLTLFVTVQGRAVNISNTWVLPEEGFPVFYRYFRDRISWYEADAVCQFHHANLVTVDTTAQYDAVRAYLKELDISSAVWVGLIRSNPDGDFTWTDYRGLSGDGYWSAAPDTRSAPLCAAADPAADYRWEARACGGPSVASFICELPVPQWALGNEGCMVRALPAVTVLYLPESAAVQLTADCGLALVKRVQCTGNMKRDELLKELACAEEDQTTPSSNGTSPVTLWQITTDSVFTNQDTNNEVSTDENITTEHEDDINQSSSIKVISTSYSVIPDISNKLSPKPFSAKKLYKIPLNKNIDLDIINTNNLQSNETPKQGRGDDFFTNEQNEKIDDKLLQHTKLHDELARLGNLETIFSQPTDHFVPPLVMAKAKISDDMTALSIEAKLAQQLAERQLIKHNIQPDNMATYNNVNKELHSTEFPNSILTTVLPSTNFIPSSKENNYEQTSNIMHTMPKKYNNKYNDAKHKMVKNYVPKSLDTPETETTSASFKLNTKDNDITSSIKTITEHTHIDVYPTKSQSEEDVSLELTVIIKDPRRNQSNVNIMTTNSPLINTRINQNNIEDNEKNVTSSQNVSSSITNNHNLVKEDVIDIHIFNDQNNHSDVLLDVTTRIPIFKQSTDYNTENITKDIILQKSMTVLTFINRNNPTTINVDSTATSKHSMVENFTTTDGIFQTTSDLFLNITGELDIDLNVNNTIFNTSKVYNISKNTMSPSNESIKESIDSIIDSDFDLERNNTDTSSEIDDFQSPLLSGASEPLHKPNRSRRPQQQNRNKFNPFRILG